MADEHASDPDMNPPEDGRRKGDRRKVQEPYDGPDRRSGDRRTGKDRRTTPRS